MKKVIYVTTILHRYGETVDANATLAGAEAQVAAYASKWWPEAARLLQERDSLDEAPEEPEDAMELIKAYFDAMDDESYEIHEITLGD